jgi:hypothetical protein
MKYGQWRDRLRADLEKNPSAACVAAYRALPSMLDAQCNCSGGGYSPCCRPVIGRLDALYASLSDTDNFVGQGM